MTRHAKERARERYGIGLDVDHVISDIRHNRAKLMHCISKNKSIYLVNHHGVQLLALYHRKHRAIITVLPPDHHPSEGWAEKMQRMIAQDELLMKNLAAVNAARPLPSPAHTLVEALNAPQVLELPPVPKFLMTVTPQCGPAQVKMTIITDPAPDFPVVPTATLKAHGWRKLFVGGMLRLVRRMGWA